jgi:hypothetical protein
MLADWSRMVEAGLGGGRESIERKASGKGCKSESQYRKGCTIGDLYGGQGVPGSLDQEK